LKSNAGEIKDKLILAPRTLSVIKHLSYGPSTHDSLRNAAFARYPDLDYTKFLPKGRLLNNDGNNNFISRQQIKEKLTKLENNKIIESYDYVHITDGAYPVHTKVYALTEKGAGVASRLLKRDITNIRFGLPSENVLGHEILISRVIDKLYSGENHKNSLYTINFIHADRVLRSLYSISNGHLPSKGVHFFDLLVSITTHSGSDIIMRMELANNYDYGLFWKDKLHYFKNDPFYILVNDGQLLNNLIVWIQQWKLPNPVYLTWLSKFLDLGLEGTPWKRVTNNEIREIQLNID